MPKVTIQTLRDKKAAGEKITFLTGYDYPFAVMEQKAGIDVVLVGDSMGMVVFGYDSTLPVTMDLMVPHVKEVLLYALRPKTAYSLVVDNLRLIDRA